MNKNLLFPKRISTFFLCLLMGAFVGCGGGGDGDNLAKVSDPAPSASSAPQTNAQSGTPSAQDTATTANLPVDNANVTSPVSSSGTSPGASSAAPVVTSGTTAPGTTPSASSAPQTNAQSGTPPAQDTGTTANLPVDNANGTSSVNSSGTSPGASSAASAVISGTTGPGLASSTGAASQTTAQSGTPPAQDTGTTANLPVDNANGTSSVNSSGTSPGASSAAPAVISGTPAPGTSSTGAASQTTVQPGSPPVAAASALASVTGSVSDTNRPRVRLVDPVENQEFVSVDVKVMLTFTEAMNPSDITTAAFTLKDDMGNLISGEVSYSGTVATFIPDADLDYEMDYIVSLSCGVRDLAGNTVRVNMPNSPAACQTASESYSYTFKTDMDTITPTIIRTDPSFDATGIYVDRAVTLTFSEKMTGSDINISTFTLNDGVSDISGTVTYSGVTATFTPHVDLDYDTKYTATLSNTVTDLAGNSMGTFNRIVFTTTLPGYVSSLSGLPDTGQTTSYTDTFGEDSDYTFSPPSYTDNGNGTVKDNVTNLMWQRENDSTKRKWEDAVSYCSDLTLAGNSDWRLPTVFELESITDSEVSAPAINSAYFPNTTPYFYWSYTARAGHTAFAWYVHFGRGNVDFNYRANSYYVRCVR